MTFPASASSADLRLVATGVLNSLVRRWLRSHRSRFLGPYIRPEQVAADLAFGGNPLGDLVMELRGAAAVFDEVARLLPRSAGPSSLSLDRFFYPLAATGASALSPDQLDDFLQEAFRRELPNSIAVLAWSFVAAAASSGRIIHYAQKLKSAGRAAFAYEFMNRGLKENGATKEYLVEKALLAKINGDFRNAARLFEKLAADDPKNSFFRRELAAILPNTRDTKSASAFIQRLGFENPVCVTPDVAVVFSDKIREMARRPTEQRTIAVCGVFGVGTLVSAFSNFDGRVRLILQGKEDVAWFQQNEHALRNDIPNVEVVNVTAVGQGPSGSGGAQPFLEAVATTDGLLTSRFHAMMIALIAGIDTLVSGVANDKRHRVCVSIGSPPWVHFIDAMVEREEELLARAARVVAFGRRDPQRGCFDSLIVNACLANNAGEALLGASAQEVIQQARPDLRCIIADPDVDRTLVANASLVAIGPGGMLYDLIGHEEVALNFQNVANYFRFGYLAREYSIPLFVIGMGSQLRLISRTTVAFYPGVDRRRDIREYT